MVLVQDRVEQIKVGVDRNKCNRENDRDRHAGLQP